MSKGVKAQVSDSKQPNFKQVSSCFLVHLVYKGLAIAAQESGQPACSLVADRKGRKGAGVGGKGETKEA